MVSTFWRAHQPGYLWPNSLCPSGSGGKESTPGAVDGSPVLVLADVLAPILPAYVASTPPDPCRAPHDAGGEPHFQLIKDAVVVAVPLHAVLDVPRGSLCGQQGLPFMSARGPHNVALCEAFFCRPGAQVSGPYPLQKPWEPDTFRPAP